MPETGRNDRVVAFADAAEKVRASRALRAEILQLQESLGPNLYSDFVLKNGYRPDPAQAATIGRVIGHRVKAADGSLQPAPTRAEKAAAGRAKKRSRKDVDGLEQILRLRRALASLAQNDRDPADIIHYIDPLFDDVLGDSRAVSARCKLDKPIRRGVGA